VEYYALGKNAKMRDLILAIRADEACHREVNHHFSDVPSWQIIEKETIHVTVASDPVEVSHNKH